MSPRRDRSRALFRLRGVRPEAVRRAGAHLACLAVACRPRATSHTHAPSFEALLRFTLLAVYRASRSRAG